MNKLLISTLIASTLTISTQAGEFELLPVLSGEHVFNPAIAVVVGNMRSDESDSSSHSLNGIEFQMDCPLLKVPTGKIRQQVDLTYYDYEGFKMTQFNLNPHYQMHPFSDDFYIGIGPSFGVAKVETENDSDTIFTYGGGLSLGANITSSTFFSGEVRYEQTTDAELNNITDDLNNIKFLGKLGFTF